MAGIYEEAREGMPMHKMPAASYNLMLEAALAHRRQRPVARPGDVPGMIAGILIENRTNPATNLPQFAIVGRGAKVVVPPSDEDFHFGKLAFQSAEPDPTAPFAILQEPCAAGTDDARPLAPAIMHGVSLCRMDVIDDTHEWAAPIAGDYTQLRTQAAPGPARILWLSEPNDDAGGGDAGSGGAPTAKLSLMTLTTIMAPFVLGTNTGGGAEGGTGTRWALVRLDDDREFTDYVTCTKTGNSGGIGGSFFPGKLSHYDQTNGWVQPDPPDILIFKPSVNNAYPVLNHRYTGKKYGLTLTRYFVSAADDNTGNSPFDDDGTNWTTITATNDPADAAPWNSGTTYNPGQFVTLGGDTYMCVTASTNNTPPNATYWASPDQNQGVYSPAATYADGDYVSVTVDVWSIWDQDVFRFGVFFREDDDPANNIGAQVEWDKGPGVLRGSLFEPGGTGKGFWELIPPVYDGVHSTWASNTQFLLRGNNWPHTAEDDKPSFAVSDGSSIYVGAWGTFGGVQVNGGLVTGGSFSVAGTDTGAGTYAPSTPANFSGSPASMTEQQFKDRVVAALAGLLGGPIP